MSLAKESLLSKLLGGRPRSLAGGLHWRQAGSDGAASYFSRAKFRLPYNRAKKTGRPECLVWLNLIWEIPPCYPTAVPHLFQMLFHGQNLADCKKEIKVSKFICNHHQAQRLVFLGGGDSLHVYQQGLKPIDLRRLLEGYEYVV